ncbi:MAG TPA: sigma-70 family RNA polymerase sigma factor [Erysipelothrix sp.]
MIGDYEYLYMIRQKDEYALEAMIEKYDRLIWKRALTFYNTYRPCSIEIEDLYQEGKYGLYESFYKYDESLGVGLAHFVDICVSSRMTSCLRRCNGKAYKLLDYAQSLDMNVSEETSLKLYDVIGCDDPKIDPQFMTLYYEAEDILDELLKHLKHQDKKVYELLREGYSYKEIAEKLNITNKKVDNILQKIRKKIKVIQSSLD